MKRDMDLCRDILLDLESKPFDPGSVEIKIGGKSEEEISYHLMLLDQAGLVKAVDLSKSTQRMKWRANYLTWDGHDFLDASRNETVWERAKATLQDKSVGMTFEILKALLIEYCKQLISGDSGT